MLVIVADRDPDDREALRCTLEASSCEVVTVDDGTDVVRLACQRNPEAVVVSSSLGHMGGFAVARQLKTIASTGEIAEPKIVVLIDRDADAWLAGWSQCDAWLTKPIDAVAVDMLLKEMFEQSVA